MSNSSMRNRLEAIAQRLTPKGKRKYLVGIIDPDNPNVVDLGDKTMTRAEWNALPGRKIHVPDSEEDE